MPTPDRLSQQIRRRPQEFFGKEPPLPQTVSIDSVGYMAPTWEQMGALNFKLAQEIIKSGLTFDRIIALARGGWTWSKDLADLLKTPNLSSVRIKSYNGQSSGQIEIVQPLTDRISGERILITDEVADTGKSLEFILSYLNFFGPETIHTATLCYKPSSNISPDFYAFKTPNWVIFPHERHEFVDDCFEKWSKENISFDEIRRRLLKIGIPRAQVDYFLSLKN